MNLCILWTIQEQQGHILNYLVKPEYCNFANTSKLQFPSLSYSSESKLNTKHFEATRITAVSKSPKDDTILDKVYLFTVSNHALMLMKIGKTRTFTL